MFRYVRTTTWQSAGNFSKALAKGLNTTTWIWNLHINAHDFGIENTSNFLRKVFIVNASHVAVVLAWLSGMHFHGAYFSNYSSWIKAPKYISPSCQTVWELVGQDILNTEAGGYHQGLYITSSLFSLWRSSGIINLAQLKIISVALEAIALILLVTASMHMKVIEYPYSEVYRKLKTISIYHITLMIGLSSLSWSGHLVHISIPTCRLLDPGIQPNIIPTPADILSSSILKQAYPEFGNNLYPGFNWSLPKAKYESK